MDNMLYCLHIMSTFGTGVFVKAVDCVTFCD